MTPETLPASLALGALVGLVALVAAPASLALGALVGLVALVVALALLWALRRSAARRAAAAGPNVLGGRGFIRSDRLSVARDEAFMDLVLSAGVQEPDIQPGEDPKAYGERLFRALHEAQVIRPMLACLIVPLDTPEWTPAIADETAQFLGELDDPTDKARCYALVAELLCPFYKAGLASWARSRTSGAPNPEKRNGSPATSPARAPATGGA
jgi:hypothetical protein